jgi:hypothetical protein
MNTFVIAGPNTITTTVGTQVGGSPAIAQIAFTMQTQCNTDIFSVTGKFRKGLFHKKCIH